MEATTEVDAAVVTGTGAAYRRVSLMQLMSGRQAHAVHASLGETDDQDRAPAPLTDIGDEAVGQPDDEGRRVVRLRRGNVVVEVSAVASDALDAATVAADVARAIDGRLAPLVPSEADVVA